MLTVDEQETAAMHLAIITAYDAQAGRLSRQIWERAQHHSDEAARIWLFELNNAVLALHVAKHTRIGTTAQQVLDGRLTLW